MAILIHEVMRTGFSLSLEFLHLQGDLEKHHLEFPDLGEARRHLRCSVK